MGTTLNTGKSNDFSEGRQEIKEPKKPDELKKGEGNEARPFAFYFGAWGIGFACAVAIITATIFAVKAGTIPGYAVKIAVSVGSLLSVVFGYVIAKKLWTRAN